MKDYSVPGNRLTDIYAIVKVNGRRLVSLNGFSGASDKEGLELAKSIYYPYLS